MSLEEDLFAALSPLAAGTRVNPDAFPQRGQPDPWPSIRYLIVSGVPGVTICGTGGDLETDVHLQIDGVASTPAERDQLRIDIQQAMGTFPTPATCEGYRKFADLESKGFVVSLDYLIEPSSDPTPP